MALLQASLLPMNSKLCPFIHPAQQICLAHSQIQHLPAKLVICSWVEAIFLPPRMADLNQSAAAQVT